MTTLIQPGPMSLVRRQFLRAGDTFAAHAAVFEETGSRLFGRLDLLAIDPRRILDLGCRSGYQLDQIQQRYPQATIIGADPAPGAQPDIPRSWSRWLRKRQPTQVRIACDPHHLPFGDGSFDLIVSNMLLPWCHSPHTVFAEVARVLASGGAFLFTSAGPDTLIEYRALWADVDSHLHAFGLVDMHDLGDAMLAGGFAAPVLDRDNLSVDYPDLSALQSELRGLGAGNIAVGRRAGLMSPAVGAALFAALSRRESGRQSSLSARTQPEAGETETSPRFSVTLELVQGHGWKGELMKGRQGNDDAYTIPLDSVRSALGTRKTPR